MKITFTTGLMGAGKSKNLIKFYRDDIKRKFAFAANLTEPSGTIGKVESRNGEFIEAIYLNSQDDPVKIAGIINGIVSVLGIEKIYMDEIQFLSEDVLLKIVELAVELEIDVHFFGLLTDFTGKAFPGSNLLISNLPKEDILYLTRYCEADGCKNIASNNARIINGKIVKEGDTFLEEKSTYMAVCEKCYNK